MKSGRGLEKLCSVFFQQPFGPLPGSSYSGGFWRLLSFCKIWKVLHRQPSLSSGQIGRCFSKNEIPNAKCEKFCITHLSPLLVRMVHPTISTRLSHLKKMDWALGKWEMLRWILQKLDFWRSISGLHIVLKVQNRGQPIQNYWCRRPYCLSVKGLAIIDLPWSSFGKCFWDDKNWGWESFPLPVPSKDWYPTNLQISIVTFSCLFIYLEERFACSGAR